MTDLKRWSEADGAASATERRLVRAGQEHVMPADERQAVWSQIVSTLAAGGSPPLPAKAASVTSSGTLLAVKGAKIVCVLAAVSGLAAGGYRWSKGSPRFAGTAPAQASAPAQALPTTSVFAETTRAVESPLARTETPDPLPATQTAVTSHASQLRDESLAVMAARQALRSNDAGKALRLLEQAQQRFKKGALTEEREALTIEALAKSGQSARASVLAKAFLAHYPRSPHAADVQRFVAN